MPNCAEIVFIIIVFGIWLFLIIIAAYYTLSSESIRCKSSKELYNSILREEILEYTNAVIQEYLDEVNKKLELLKMYTNSIKRNPPFENGDIVEIISDASNCYIGLQCKVYEGNHDNTYTVRLVSGGLLTITARGLKLVRKGVK